MHPSRQIVPLSLALAAALAFAGCQGAPTAPLAESTAPTQDPAASPSAGNPQASPSGTPASPGENPGASPAATNAPAPDLVNTIIKGTAYDETTAFVPDGTVVTATSLDVGRPYSGSTTTSSGAYVLNQIPIDTQVEIAVTRPGWTTRRRVTVARVIDPRFPDRNVFNFGGKNSDTNKSGLAYFISQYPEIERVEPVNGDASLPNDKVAFKLVMSEALDSENRRRLAAAFTIVPNNSMALPQGAALESEVSDEKAIDDLRNGDPSTYTSALVKKMNTMARELKGLRIGINSSKDADPPSFRYAFRQSSGFLGGVETSEFKWDEAGKVAVFSLDAPLKTRFDDEAEYAFVLIARDSQPIVDPDGKQFGQNEEGKFRPVPRNTLIYNAIAEAGINTDGYSEPEERWADTHDSFTVFRLMRDQVRPQLVSVLARRGYVDDQGAATDRVELTFSEPMVAYPRISHPGVLSLNNYVIASDISESAAESHKISSGDGASVVASDATAQTVQDALASNVGIVISANGESAGNFKITFSVKDPRVIVISLPDSSLPPHADYIKVYAGGDADGTSGTEFVSDPAGNSLDSTAQTKVGPIL